jgi:small subunit ribosomal protein S13
MVQIAMVELPANKNIYVALSRIYGIGKKFKKNSRSRKILEKLNINPLLKVKDLNDEKVSLINEQIRQFKLEDDLCQEKEQDIEAKKMINCYQGKRHSMGKKVHGQSTHHNNRTRPHGIASTTKKAIPVAGRKGAPKQG